MSDKLSQRYQRIYDQIQVLLKDTEDKIAKMATVSAVLHHKMPHFFWTGFYILKNDRLIVGPYQGSVACLELSEKKGVCWSGVLHKKTVVVPDVHQFPGHIACDSRSNSEIVVPLKNKEGSVTGVLDVDSRKFNAFTAVDKEWLEKIALLI
ncbi:MAG: GAF domain-containing protein [Candidatus Aminicenantes bacterium]|nr:GAF domain-containing protein [Candidatus Aminicenantes bacterium]